MGPHWLHPNVTCYDNNGHTWSYNNPQNLNESQRRSKSSERAKLPTGLINEAKLNCECGLIKNGKSQSKSQSDLFTCGSEKRKRPNMTPAVNVYMTNMNMDYQSRHEMLHWVNQILGSNFVSVEELGSGIGYCQLMNILFPGSVPLNKVKYQVTLQHEAMQNFELLQFAFTRFQVDKAIPGEKLSKGRFLDNFQFLLWFKKFFMANQRGGGHAKSCENMAGVNLNEGGFMARQLQLQKCQPIANGTHRQSCQRGWYYSSSPKMAYMKTH